MRKHLAAFCAVIVCHCGVPAPALTETLTQEQKKATLTLSAPKIQNGKLEIALSDEIILTLTVKGTAPLEVKSGDRVVAGNLWQVTEVSAPRITSATGGTQIWEQVLRIEPMQPGPHKLQFAPLEYSEQGGPEQSVQWQEVPVQVTTTAKPTIDDLKPPPGIEELPGAEAVSPWWVPALAAGTGVLILALLILWWRHLRRKTRTISRPPAEVALQDLNRLQASLPGSLEESTVFHTRLANVVRSYLEARFQVQASRQTSEEYYQTLAQSGLVGEEQLQLLRDFLQRCDLPRFAPLQPAPEECLQTLALARSFVEQVNSRQGEEGPERQRDKATG
jgi:hypothetical protein